MRKSKTSQVYLFEAENGRIKIGESVDPERRLSVDIAPHSPISLELVKAWPHSRAPQIERRMHQILAGQRWNYEWFDCTQAEAEAAFEQAKKEIESRGGSDMEPMSVAGEIYDDLLQQIQDDNLRHGDPLPSMSELADRYGVSYAPARDALTQLGRVGAITQRKGKVATVAWCPEPSQCIAPDGTFMMRSRVSTVEEQSRMGLRRHAKVIEVTDKNGTVVAPAEETAIKVTTHLEPWDVPPSAEQWARRGNRRSFGGAPLPAY